MPVVPLESLSAAVATLQQAFAGREGKAVSAEEIAKHATAKGFPDADLAVAVWKHLEAQAGEVTRNVVERRLSEDKISKALFYVLLDPEFAKTKRSKRFKELSHDFRAVLRQLAQRLGLAMSEIATVAETTGMGLSPTIRELADEFAAWLRQAHGE
ncbi:MAG: hypothetical protein HY903_02175 [Deltaproteobacteria bacterium]|nr:hypothetical protein [Deltaproteobacteria bacterium]